MKKYLASIFVLIVSATSLFAQDMPQKRKSPHDTAVSSNITVTYGRPYKNGREIFGSLESYGEIWRTGADEATEITIKKDCKIGDKDLKAGTYTLFTIPGKTMWTIIFNSELKQWGAYNYDKIKDKDVLRTSVEPKHLSKVVEQLTIDAEKNGIKIKWDHTSVTVPMKF